jgi:hypothetical protein
LNELKEKIAELEKFRFQFETKADNEEKEEFNSINNRIQYAQKKSESKTIINNKEQNDNDNDTNFAGLNEVQKKESNFELAEENNPEFIKGEIFHSIEELGMIIKNINTDNQQIILNLLYKASADSDKASVFHKKCDNIAPTLTLIETKEGFRYGGFTTQFWESTEQSIFKKDKNAFIFSLDTEKKYDVTDEEKSIQCSMYWGPYFGEGGAICVPDNFLEEKNAFYQWPSSYDISEKDELTFGQEHNINISKYEVFEIIIRNEENGDINGENNEGDINEENNEGENNEGDNIEMENEQGELHELEPRKDNED